MGGTSPGSSPIKSRASGGWPCAGRMVGWTSGWTSATPNMGRHFGPERCPPVSRRRSIETDSSAARPGSSSCLQSPHETPSPRSLAVPTNAPINRKLRMGLVGGGQGAFIGRVHATAAVLDNRAALVAGALSSDPTKAKASAPDYDIQPERAYGSFSEMLAGESKLPASERIDFVSI